LFYHIFWYNYLYINCILVIKHPDEDHRSDWNVMVRKTNNMWLSILIYLHLLVYHKRIRPLPYLISMKISYVYLCHDNGKQLYHILLNTTVYRTLIYIYIYKMCIIIPHHIAEIAPFTNISVYLHKGYLSLIRHTYILIKYWICKPAAVAQCHVPEQQHFYGNFKISQM
jgi:hypothetical protein